jgi:hypothetical protein
VEGKRPLSHPLTVQEEGKAIQEKAIRKKRRSKEKLLGKISIERKSEILERKKMWLYI